MAPMIAEKAGPRNRKLSSKMSVAGSGNYCIAILAQSGSRCDRVRLALLHHWRPRAPGAARLIPESWPNRKPHLSEDSIR